MLCWDACQWTKGQERWTETKNLIGFRTHEKQDHGQKLRLPKNLSNRDQFKPWVDLLWPWIRSQLESITSKFAEDFCNCNSFWNSSIFADFIFFLQFVFATIPTSMGFESQLQQFQWFTSLPSTWPAPTCPYATAHIVPSVAAPPVQPRPLTAWQISLQKLPPLKYLQYSYYSYSHIVQWKLRHRFKFLLKKQGLILETCFYFHPIFHCWREDLKKIQTFKQWHSCKLLPRHVLSRWSSMEVALATAAFGDPIAKVATVGWESLEIKNPNPW